MGHKHPAKTTKGGQELSQHSGIGKRAHKHKRKLVLNLQNFYISSKNMSNAIACKVFYKDYNDELR